MIDEGLLLLLLLLLIILLFLLVLLLLQLRLLLLGHQKQSTPQIDDQPEMGDHLRRLPDALLGIGREAEPFERRLELSSPRQLRESLSPGHWPIKDRHSNRQLLSEVVARAAR